MSEEENKQLQDDYKTLQDDYKTLKEQNDLYLKTIEDHKKIIEALTNDKKSAEDRYTDLFKQTILVSKPKEEPKSETKKEIEVMKVEDLYII